MISEIDWVKTHQAKEEVLVRTTQLNMNLVRPTFIPRTRRVAQEFFVARISMISASL